MHSTRRGASLGLPVPLEQSPLLDRVKRERKGQSGARIEAPWSSGDQERVLPRAVHNLSDATRGR
jgi:hypothetical protein